MIPIIMPQVGQDIRTAKIIEWRKKENDPVEKGDVILIVESEKAAFEVEAEESGVLLKILYEEGEEVEVFKPLAYIGQPAEASEEQSPDAERVPEARPLSEQEREPTSDAARRELATGRPIASPSARRLAKELGVDLQKVKGSGPGTRITRQDILAAASSVAVAVEQEERGTTADDTILPFDKMRKRIADRLTLSKQTIPHFYLFVDVDMSDALRWRAETNRGKNTRITITDILIRACALALAKFERMNAHVDRERVILKRRVDIGVATSVDNGLLVPVIPDADKFCRCGHVGGTPLANRDEPREKHPDNDNRKGIGQISEISKQNAESARRGILNPHTVGTFTVTTLGMCSIREYLPIINPPECAILAAGTVEQRVEPVAGNIAIREMMTLSLACDHRAVDGVYAAGFLNEVKRYLEKGTSDDEAFRF